MLVLDSSVALFFALPNPKQTIAQQQFKLWANNNEKLIAPTLWAYETTSALTKGVHFGTLTQDEADDALDLLVALPVELIVPTPDLRQKAMEWTFKLNRAPAYDSFYVALAEQFQCPLWTGDKKLVNAMATMNISWVNQM